MATVFDDLVGQEPAVAILQGAAAAARTGEETQEMTHAWIFTGPPGSGRSSAAIAFARTLWLASIWIFTIMLKQLIGKS